MILTKESKQEKPGVGKRHVICAIACYWYIAFNFSRYSISVAVVGMTSANSSNPNFPIFDWDEKQKSVISSSYSAGLLVACLVTGELIRLFGPSFVMHSSVIAQAVLSAITPICTIYGGWTALIIIRVLIGFTLGTADPLLFYISSKWFPPNERHFLMNIVQSSVWVSPTVAGFLSEGPTGWPSIFYLTSSMLFLFSALWKWLGDWSPEECRNIDAEEKIYTENCLSAVKKPKGGKVPWTKILTSLPVYAILAAEICQGIIMSLLTTEVPLFLEAIHKTTVLKDGLLSSLPTCLCIAYVYIIGAGADILVTRGILRTSQIRKISSSIAITGNVVLLGLIAVVGKSLSATVVILFASYFAMTFTFIGYLVNPIDISSNYSQSIVGLCRAIESIASYAGPLIFSLLLTDSTSLRSWGNAFAFTVAPCFLLNAVYVFFGRAEVQPWDAMEENDSIP